MVITKENILNTYKSRNSLDFTWDIYQPIPLPGYEETYKFAGRSCIDRIYFIREQIKKRFGDKKLKILDIGSNTGFFVFELSKDGHNVTGLDTNKDFVERCNFLNSNWNFDNKPRFIHGTITTKNINEHHLEQYDLILSFSVFHHFKDLVEFMYRFSNIAKYAFIEIDGDDYGETILKSFYLNVTPIGFANDLFCREPKIRKTFECDNTKGYQIKNKYYGIGRGVFKKDDRVIKRQLLKPTHSFLNTSLIYERNLYLHYKDIDFFPKFFDYRINNNFHEIEIEFIDNIGTPNKEEFIRFYNFMESEKMIILDFVPNMFLFNKNNKIKIVDLESIVPINNKHYFLKRKNYPIQYDTNQKQLEKSMQFFVK